MATQKKITRVTGGSESASPDKPSTFIPTPENKTKANTLRFVAALMWLLAIAAQIVAISMLFHPPIDMTWLIILIAIDLVMVVIGSLLWKRSNRLDPASEREKFKFFMQNQLGVVAAVVAFAPFVIFILGSKNLDKKQKGLLTGIAAAALVVAGLLGADFNPPSVEQYTEETNRVEWLNNGQNDVYWTKYGSVYHVFNDCPYINTSKTSEIFEGTVVQARELKHITSLCSLCESRAIKEHGLNERDYNSSEQK